MREMCGMASDELVARCSYRRILSIFSATSWGTAANIAGILQALDDFLRQRGGHARRAFGGDLGHGWRRLHGAGERLAGV